MAEPKSHADWCEAALRNYANSLSDDIETDVMAWALDEIVRLRARVRELELMNGIMAKSIEKFAAELERERPHG